MQLTHLQPVDLAIVAIYFVAVLPIGFLLERQTTILANLHATFWAGIILTVFGLLVVLMNRLNRIDGRGKRP